MSTLDETPADDAPVRGAQTVAPVQASALLYAASILGEGGYTPTQQLGGTVSSPSRLHEEELLPVAPVAPVAVPEPVATVVPPAPAPAPEPVEVVAAVEVPPTKGWFARLLDRLFGRS